MDSAVVYKMSLEVVVNWQLPEKYAIMAWRENKISTQFSYKQPPNFAYPVFPAHISN